MFLTNPKKATLKKFRSSSFYDDEATTEKTIDIIPYNEEMRIRFGIVTIPEAKGYFITRNIDAKEGDQVIFNSHTYTIIQVDDRWQFNKIVNKVLVVK